MSGWNKTSSSLFSFFFHFVFDRFTDKKRPFHSLNNPKNNLESDVSRPLECKAATFYMMTKISGSVPNQAFESTLKSWEDKRKIDSYRASRPRLNSQQSMEYLTEEECAQVQQLGIVADTLISK